MELDAHAKINLYLGVHPERDDRGYHRVDSLMCRVSVADRVTVTPAGSLQVQCVPQAPCPPQKNTAFRAATALGQLVGRDPAVLVRIEKRVPDQAGLGGGSSDAASVLRALARLWGLDPEDERVQQAARSVGADVPFFLFKKPLLLTGAGDVPARAFEPLRLDVALVRPPGPGVSTPEAYASFDRDPVPAAPLAPVEKALERGDREALVAALANNLGPVAERLAPQVRATSQWLRGLPEVERVLVCGSGSCVAGVCPDAAAAAQVAEAARAQGSWAEAAHTL